MSKRKYDNKKLKKYFEKYVNGMSVENKYKPLLVDILMRRANTYDLSDEEIRQDVVSLLYNLEKISVQEMPDGYSNAWGLYVPCDKAILISKDAMNQKDEVGIYQTITHEVYHALSKDENGIDRLGGYNSITGQYNSSLLEAIVEKSSYRAAFGNDRQENIYYNNSARGYGDITFIVDALEATYGVSEKEFLKHGIMGREHLSKFLAERSGETPASAYMFLDSIEANYALLHRALYPLPEQESTPYEKARDMESAFVGIYNLCENKIAERIARTQVESFEEVSDLNDELKYDHNKLSAIMDNRLQHFSQYYDYRLRDNVYAGVNNSRLATLTRINDIGSVVDSVPNFSDENNFLAVYSWAAAGKLAELPNQTREYYGINLKLDHMLPMTQEIVDRAFYEEELGPQYNNSKIKKLFKKFKSNDKGFLKNGIEKIKNFFSRNNQKLLTSGAMPQMESQVETMESSTIFPQITKEQQEQYNNQVRQAVENLGKSHKAEDVSKEIDIEEK